MWQFMTVERPFDRSPGVRTDCQRAASPGRCGTQLCDAEYIYYSAYICSSTQSQIQEDFVRLLAMCWQYHQPVHSGWIGKRNSCLWPSARKEAQINVPKRHCHCHWESVRPGLQSESDIKSRLQTNHADHLPRLCTTRLCDKKNKVEEGSGIEKLLCWARWYYACSETRETKPIVRIICRRYQEEREAATKVLNSRVSRLKRLFDGFLPPQQE